LVEKPARLWFGAQMLRCYATGDQHVGKSRRQPEAFDVGPLGDLVPDDQVVTVVDRVPDPSRLSDEVADCCGTDDRHPGKRDRALIVGPDPGSPHGKPRRPGVLGAGARRSGARGLGRERIAG
jgi:hypothetical protein